MSRGTNGRRLRRKNKEDAGGGKKHISPFTYLRI
jgi:hypothetical protein